MGELQTADRRGEEVWVWLFLGCRWAFKKLVLFIVLRLVDSSRLVWSSLGDCWKGYVGRSGWLWHLELGDLLQEQTLMP